MPSSSLLSRARAPLIVGLALVALRFFAEQSRDLFLFSDSFQSYAHFRFALGNLLSAGELPQWLPFAVYGSPGALYNQVHLSPFNILAALLGWAMGWDNAWVLFTSGIALELAVLCAGTWLLAGELYETRAARWAVVLGAVFLTSWHVQQFWSHRMVVYWPLLLFYTLRFHRTGDAADMAKGCLAGLFLLCGAISYAAPVDALLVLVVYVAAVVLLRKRWAMLDRKSFLRPTAWALWALVAAYGWLMARAFDEVRLLAPGRNADGSVSRDVFLNYGGSALEKLPEFITGFPQPHVETYCYLGLMGVGLILLALWRGRTRMMMVMLCATVFLVLLSLGPHGIIAGAVYHLFPMADQFRHLSMLLPLARLLLLLLAGFGVEALAAADGPRRLRMCLLVAAIAMLGGKWMFFHNQPLSSWVGWLPEIGAAVSLCALLLSSRVRAASPPVAVTAVLLLELALGQWCLLSQYPKIAPFQDLRAIGMDLKHAQPLPFSPHRVTGDSNDPRWTALSCLARRQPTNNATLLHFMGLDLGAPIFRADFASESTLRDIPDLQQNILDRSNGDIPSSERLAGVFWKRLLLDPKNRQRLGCGEFSKLVVRQGADETIPTVLHFSSNRLRVRTETSDPQAMLRYADSFDPRWRASLDGQPVAVEDGHPFKLLRLPPGRHEVEFVFHDRAQDWTLRFVGVAAVLALAALLVQEVRRCRD